MAIIASVLFIAASVAAVIAIWHSVRAALPAFRALRMQLANGAYEGTITVSTMQTRDELENEQPPVSPLRHRGRTRPKPVTHRLHHFAGAVRAA